MPEIKEVEVKDECCNGQGCKCQAEKASKAEESQACCSTDSKTSCC